MKNPSDPSNAVSRRSFAKSIAAAVVAAQVASATTPEQNSSQRTPEKASPTRTPDPCSCDAPADQPIKCQNVVAGLETEPHEPPIILTNGSLRFDIGRELKFPPDNITGHSVRHFKFKLTEQSYANIHRVQVLTERDKSIENFFYYPIRRCHLGLWLQKRMGMGWEPLSAEPQILIAFTINPQGIPEFSLETDKLLNTKSNSFKPSRPNRYEHPGLGGMEHFRLAKWRLSDPASTGTVIFPGFEDDLTSAGSDINGFQLAVSFEDFPRLLERLKK